jgi:hypothetical protein
VEPRKEEKKEEEEYGNITGVNYFTESRFVQRNCICYGNKLASFSFDVLLWTLICWRPIQFLLISSLSLAI